MPAGLAIERDVKLTSHLMSATLALHAASSELNKDPDICKSTQDAAT